MFFLYVVGPNALKVIKLEVRTHRFLKKLFPWHLGEKRVLVSGVESLNLFIRPICEGGWKKHFLSLEVKVLSSNLRKITSSHQAKVSSCVK